MTTLHPWLRCISPCAEPALRLVCIPHAGSGASAYRDWARQLPAAVELHAVQLPGREDRRADSPPSTLVDCAGRIAEALATLDDRPFVLLGHSLGALLGFEAVRALESASGPVPRQFIASAARAPHCVPHNEQLHRLDDNALLSHVERYGGVPEVIRRAPDFFAAFAPVMRADFFLSETYAPGEHAQIGSPLVAVGGLADAYVPLDRLLAWRARAAGSFTAQAYAGGHFYLHERASGFVAALCERLARVVRALADPAVIKS